MEQHQADVRPAAGRVASVDDTERFLRELRQLRDGAGLGHAELAARAHYPYDSIKAAEVGPALPDLPVLSAFVRGCGGTTEEWEERWRSLTRTPSVPLEEARHGGNSAAAAAGARIGSVSQGADNPDPSIIIAALSRVAEGMAIGNDAPPMSAEAEPSWPDFPAEAPATSATPFAAASLQPDAGSEFPSGAAATLRSEAPLGFEPESPLAFRPEASAGFQSEDPFSFQPEVPAAFPPEAPAASGATPGAWGEPADVTAGGKSRGWDPIRVSTAWPAIPVSDIDMMPRADAVAAARNSAGTPTGWWGEPQDRPAGAAVRAPSAAARPSRAREAGGGFTSSRAAIVVAAVVLLCVLAVVLAIFV